MTGPNGKPAWDSFKAVRLAREALIGNGTPAWLYDNTRPGSSGGRIVARLGSEQALVEWLAGDLLLAAAARVEMALELRPRMAARQVYWQPSVQTSSRYMAQALDAAAGTADGLWDLEDAVFASKLCNSLACSLIGYVIPGMASLPSTLPPIAEAASLRAGSPLWAVSEECLHALLQTDPIDEAEVGALVDERRLRLPFPAMFVSLPLGSLLMSSGEAVSGLYLWETCGVVSDGTTRYGICIVARSRVLDDYSIDNAHGVISRMPEGDTKTLKGTENESLWHFAFNFLAALHGRYLVTETRRPTVPKNPRKAAKAAQRGEPTESYTHVDLKVRTRTEGLRGPTRPGGHASPRTHWVRGHWRSYWLLDPGDENPMGTKQRDDGRTLHRVLRWVQPFLRGADDVEAPTPVYRS